MAAAITVDGASVKAGAPARLFRAPGPVNGATAALTRDGARFLLAIADQPVPLDSGSSSRPAEAQRRGWWAD